MRDDVLLNKDFSQELLGEYVESVLTSFTLFMEETNWMKINDVELEDFTKWERDQIVDLSKEYFVRFPTYSQILALNKNFVLGKGALRPVSENFVVQYLIDRIWDSKENKKTFTGFRALEKQQESKDLTGEIGYKIYVNEDTGESVVRIERDTKRITQVITAPEDEDSILYYKYNAVTIKFNDKQDKQYTSPEVNSEPVLLTHIDNSDEDNKGFKKDSTKVYMLLAIYGNAGMKTQRGLPPYMQTFPYLKAHKGVTEDCATFLKAQSTFAAKKKLKGVTDPQLQGMARLAETFNSAGQQQSSPYVTGSMLLENKELTEYENIEIKHNAGAFYETARLLMLQIAAGSHKSEHYFGNPSNANLAIATAMELPVLKDFERLQQELKENIETVLKFCVMKKLKASKVEDIYQEAIDAGYREPEDYDRQEEIKKDLEAQEEYLIDVTVSMPAIQEQYNAAKVSGAIQAYQAGIITDKRSTEIVYTELGKGNVDDLVAEAYPDSYTGSFVGGQDKDTIEENRKKQQDAANASLDNAAAAKPGEEGGNNEER